MGTTSRWSSSTNPALIACAARSGPPTDMSCDVVAFIRRTARVEVLLDPRPGAGRRHQGRGVHDLVSRLPDLRVVPQDRWLTGIGRCGFPVPHHVVHPASVEVGTDAPLEVVDEGVDLLVRRSPVEVAVLVRDVAVERCDRRIDQPGHVELPLAHGNDCREPPTSPRKRGRETIAGCRPNTFFPLRSWSSSPWCYALLPGEHPAVGSMRSQR